MKLIVMVPCFNEEKTLPSVINSIPKKIKGISKIETMIIDDGSTDATIAVAKKLKVTHIIKHPANKGLARSFATGIKACLELKADIIVNTDGDNQYPQAQIPALIQPILEGRAEMVIADRQTDQIAYFSPIKKVFQKIGSWTVRTLSETNVPDAVSGFRAYSRNAAFQMNIVTDFSYCIETIVQASKKRIKIASVPVTVNAKTRESRLFKSTWSHMKKSSATLIRVFAMYEPMKFFTSIGMVGIVSGILLSLRFFIPYILSGNNGHLQALVVAAILIIIGFQITLMGILADLIASNRKLDEDILYRLKTKGLYV